MKIKFFVHNRKNANYLVIFLLFNSFISKNVNVSLKIKLTIKKNYIIKKIIYFFV